MMLIWAHGLGRDVNPIKELYESLTAIGKRQVAGMCLFKVFSANKKLSCVFKIHFAGKSIRKMKSDEKLRKNAQSVLLCNTRICTYQTFQEGLIKLPHYLVYFFVIYCVKKT